jgi:uncharacterized protein DUF6011
MTTLHGVFEKLRILAEADTADSGTDKRRPSWGPALVLGDEIFAALAGLNCPLPNKKVARLWATFANPNKVGRYLRVNVSTLPMEGVRVRAFELRLGTDRSGTRLLSAKRDSSDLWSVETNTWSNFPHWREYQRAEKDYGRAQDRVKNLSRWPLHTIGNVEFREHVREELPNAEAQLVKCEQAYTELEAARADYRRGKDAFGDLIKQRVAEFAGDSFAQMISGAHVTGNCAICGRGLTDPISLERGIGPECFGHIAPGLRAYLDRQTGAAA